MRRWFLPCLLTIALVACSTGPDKIAEFWRPISEPNLLLSFERAQQKLDFDMSQCRCGIYPTNATHSDVIDFQQDKQRLAETSVTIAPNKDGNCIEHPSLVVTQCMRERGWEVTNCSGRMPLPGGGSLCAAYAY